MTTAFAGIVNKYQGIAPRQIVAAVHKAAQRTGADFAYLMEKASAESGFNTKAASHKSSATGLFQFIESTWLSMVKNHGEKFGLGEYAEKIEIKNGKPCVEDCEIKEKILSLRNNPEISALMAGAYSAQNKAQLARQTSCEVGPTELYLAHFLGAGGAAKFLNAREENGSAPAAEILPQAARFNKSIFFNRATGQPRTLDEIYDKFAGKFGDDTLTTDAPASASAATSRIPSPERAERMASDTPAPAYPAPSRRTAGRASFHSAPPRHLDPVAAVILAEARDTMMKTVMSERTYARKDKFGYNS